MSKGGGSSTTTTSIDPDLKAAYLANLKQGENVAGALPVQQYAGFNPMYQAGEQQLINTSLGGPGIANTDMAAYGAQQGTMFNPMYVGGFTGGPANLARSGGYQSTDVNAAQANMGDINRYMNPYTSGVIDTTLQDIEKSRAAASQRIGQQAISAKAFGGSRQGLAEGESSRQFADQAARTAAQLRSQGFDVASGQMQQDLARQQQAAVQNAAQRTAASQFLAGARNQTSATNAAARNAMAQFNASIGQQAALANQGANLSGAQQRLSANTLLGNLAQQQQAQRYAGASNVMNAGLARQQLDQQRLDALRNIGLQKLGITSGALGLSLPSLGGTQTSPLYRNPAAGALGGAAAGSAFGGPGAAIGGLIGLLS